MNTEVLFKVEEADDSRYVATAPLYGIVTQADSVEKLHTQVRDAVACHFDASDKPKLIRLHFVRNEVLTA